jgi:hypothetical protein
MKVSIITVTHNSAATLRDTLESIQAQDSRILNTLLLMVRLPTAPWKLSKPIAPTSPI